MKPFNLSLDKARPAPDGVDFGGPMRFTPDEEVGQGLVLWKPKGALVREALTDFMREAQREAGYLPVVTPNIGHLDLYRTSGHYPYYSDSQFPPLKVDEEEYLIKPMNCPHHCRIYASEMRSYRDLPLRMAEFGTVYRYEQSGELQGLTRVRGFTQDDAHHFCTPEQLEDEVSLCIDLVQEIMGAFGFDDFKVELSVRDPENKDKYAGTDEEWEAAE